MIKIEKFSVNPKMSLGRNKQMDEFEAFLNKIGESNIIQILACPEAFMGGSGGASQVLYTVIYRG